MRVLTALLLAGCSVPVHVSGAVPAWPEWQEEIRAAQEEYPHGQCSPAGLQVTHAPDDLYTSLCEVSPSPTGQVACYLPGQEVIVLSRWALRYMVAHEAMHWLDDCSGRFDWDRPHEDPLVWGPGGALDRAYGRLGHEI